jgi:thiol-disulfide isomerase/thioredoxin
LAGFVSDCDAPASNVVCVRGMLVTTMPLVTLLRLGFGGAPTPVRPLADPEAFRALVQGTQTSGRAAVVKFSSERCKACASMQPKLERLAAGWPELDFHALTYEDGDGDNRKLFRSLGITKLPYMTIAAGGEAVDGFLCPPKKLPMLELKLEAHAGWLPPHRGWLSGRRWRRLRHRRAAW